MRVGELFEKSDDLLGQQVRIEGFFVYVGSHGYVVDSIELRDDLTCAVKVSIDNLKRVVSSKVPPSGGSKYHYLDSAVLQGVLQVSEEDGFALQCGNITSFEITKANHHFAVIP